MHYYSNRGCINAPLSFSDQLPVHDIICRFPTTQGQEEIPSKVVDSFGFTGHLARRATAFTIATELRRYCVKNICLCKLTTKLRCKNALRQLSVLRLLYLILALLWAAQGGTVKGLFLAGGSLAGFRLSTPLPRWTGPLPRARPCSQMVDIERARMGRGRPIWTCRSARSVGGQWAAVR
ncbi:hypothetical protein BJ742DRAFT_354015 [Cladochytrium replicatum]|nr:hypothetical protein BJ742DRAFT_354015 [Cladochytrium replicatum]